MKRALTCAAFSYWCFLPTWVDFATGQSGYLLAAEPWRSVFAPMALHQLLVLLAVWLAWTWFGASRILLAAGIVATGIAAAALLKLAPLALGPWLGLRAVKWTVGALAALALLQAIRHWRPTQAILFEAMLWSWPVLILISVRAFGSEAMTAPAKAYVDQPTLPMLPPPQRNATRLVWLLFDELSRSAAFESRPAEIAMPNFDRLRNESFFASAALPPSESTIHSIPALLTGRPGVLNKGWSDLPNVFRDARTLGLNAATAGWYHPYGRVLAGSVTEAFWKPQCSPYGPARQLLLFPFAGRIPGVDFYAACRQQMSGALVELLNAGSLQAADPRMGLVFLHLPVPHPPALEPSVHPSEYIANLALADRSLGVIRKALEDASLWPRTALLVSADHGWRPHIWRNTLRWTAADEQLAARNTAHVPFLVRLPGDRAPCSSAAPFDTRVSRRVAIAILSGAVTRCEQWETFIRYNSVTE